MPIHTYFTIFILGASTASLLGVVAHDLPLGDHRTTRRLACPHCHTQHRAPILSYLLQKGRCRTCLAHLSSFYPWIEITGGLLFIMPLFLPHDFSPLQLIHTWTFFSLLITVTLTDLYYGLIPNQILISFGMAFLIMQPHLFSALIGFSLFLIAAHLGKWLFKKETLGGGDIKCYFVIGLAVELNILLFSILASCLMALLYVLIVSKDKQAPIRFAPFIALGVIIVMMISKI